MNMASSRSHCIFTAHILACKVGEETVRKSKLNLVDLAGSERVWKTGVDGQILREAKYINLSLHYLEQVIVALQEKSQGKMRTHIPYRNSMMTSVLRDSIGGNCRTVMIATVTIAQEQLPETISTCRFAQRVAMISNQVTLNEEIDPNLLIKRLKQQIRDMKEEIAMLRGENENRPPLSASEIENVRSRVTGFVSDKSADADLLCGGSTMHIRAAFQIFKEMLNNGELQTVQGVEGPVKREKEYLVCGESTDVKTLQDKVSDLQYQLKQRDNEIQILVAFIRKREAAGEGPARPSSAQPATDRPSSARPATDRSNSSARPSIGRPSSARQPSARLNSITEEHGRDMTSPQLLAEKNYVAPQISRTPELQKPRSTEFDIMELPADTVPENGVIDKEKAFELFLKGNSTMEAIEENKSLLKTKYADAKALGEKVNRARDCINVLKERIEKHRVERARDYIVSGVSDGSLLEHDQEEDELLCSIDAEKRAYKEGFGQLRDTKKEIEHLHKLLEQNQAQLQADFEVHWSAKIARPVQIERPVKNPSIPRLNISGSIVPEHQASPGRGRQSPISYESSSFSSRENLRSPVSGKSDRGVDVHGKQALQIMASPSSKDYSFPSTSGAGVDKSLDYLSYPTSKQPLRETNNVAGLQPIPLTGNAAADADIIAFYKARAGVLKKVS
ncbi:hypothetical protein KC19_7G069000 [Ceratodon purpureus]|uniref:Kinesin-like protein n=1 Tax=Ceratodon purpureus TaxID=3225 RepID=A0A8T0HBM8_CERPU|nr:hypothetical protein KC19_7G069000 [Ceratodon purpureus]